jgi:hypothetical protein
MKYAITGPKGAINRISDTEPQVVGQFAKVVQITDEQAAIVGAGLASEPRVIYFYNQGELEEASVHLARILEERRPKVTAEKHIERQGYPAIRIVTLMDLEGKLVQLGKSSAKLSAVRSWLDSILGAFAANPEPRNNWPQAPFTFEETVQEAASKLQ